MAARTIVGFAWTMSSKLPYRNWNYRPLQPIALSTTAVQKGMEVQYEGEQHELNH